MNELPPILVAGLFRELNAHLLTLLRSLTLEDWHKPTSSSERNVKDIASHLLDGSVRRLSIHRDGYVSPDAPDHFQSTKELTDYINHLNATWAVATRRVSPLVLIQWLESTGEELADLFESLDPYGRALFSVAWAGESESANWFDIAREYTEKWHHTQQIFEAASKPSPIIARRLFHPCLDTFMRALPFAYRQIDAEEGASITVRVDGEAGGEWHLARNSGAWRQMAEQCGQPTARVMLDQLTAWKVFTKRMDRDTALSRFTDIRIEGDKNLGLHVIDMVSMMA